jgi:cell division protein FtsB
MTLPLRMLARLLRSGSAIVGSLLVLYFALFAFEGDRGYANYRATSQQVVAAEEKLAEVTGQRESVERKVVALRPDSIDPDMLDEQARRELGFVKADEVVVLGR